jgi:hypothetical protein
MDLFVVPTIGFKLLYAFAIVRLDRRDLVWINVTAYPTAEWVARVFVYDDDREISSLRTFRPLFRSMIVNRTFRPIPVCDCAHRRALSIASASFDASNP